MEEKRIIHFVPAEKPYLYLKVVLILEIAVLLITTATSIGCLWYCHTLMNDICKEPMVIETMAPTENVEKQPSESIVPEKNEETTSLTEPTEIIKETEPVIAYEPTTEAANTDLEMLACVIYQEHGGDNSCDECRKRVGDIVLNRVADPRFPNTIYDVLTQPSQYGRMHWTGVVWPTRASHESERHAVERAYEIAYNLLNDIDHSDLYGNGYIWQAGFHQGHDEIYCCNTYYGK